jgi:hypothetical protein
MTSESLDARVSANTDREIWRERAGDYYADSIHVTQSGGIGINCGGYVYVLPVREWHRLAAAELPNVPRQPVDLSAERRGAKAGVPSCAECGANLHHRGFAAPQPAAPEPSELVGRIRSWCHDYNDDNGRFDARHDAAYKLLKECANVIDASQAVRRMVDEQAEDEGLWFIAKTAPEAYLQAALRKLHTAVDSAQP